LEQKHAEAVRELSKEREALAQHSARLEREIAALQLTDAKNAAELSSLREVSPTHSGMSFEEKSARVISVIAQKDSP